MSDRPAKPARPPATGKGAIPLESQIAETLKAFYTSVEQEPIPDLFLDLLERLDSVEKANKP